MSGFKISVVIPAFNAVDSIIGCIESVINQTFSVFEIIVVNDGSEDNTLNILHSFKCKHNDINLVIITHANCGPAKSRNEGIRVAKGDWIAFLDADDKWLPTKIECQVNLLKMHSDCAIVGTKLFPYKNKTKNGYISLSFISLLFSNSLFTSSVIVRKDIICKYFFDENKKYSEDYKLWLQILRENNGLVLLDGLVVYASNMNKYKRKALSNSLWRMEISELGNYRFIYKQKDINLFLYLQVSVYSFLKFIRRFIISFYYNCC